MLDVGCSAAKLRYRPPSQTRHTHPHRLRPFDVGCSMLNVRCSAAKRVPGHHLKHATSPRCLRPFDVGCSMLNVRCSAAKRATGHHLKHASSSLPPPPLRCWMFDVGCWMFCRKARRRPPSQTRHIIPVASCLRCWMFCRQAGSGHHSNTASSSSRLFLFPPPAWIDSRGRLRISSGSVIVVNRCSPTHGRLREESMASSLSAPVTGLAATWR